MGPLTAARWAVFGFFGINGATLAVWVSYIPTVKQELEINEATLGWILLTVAAGALVAMQIAGRLIDRIGSVRVTIGAGIALPLVLVGPAFAASLPTLLVACFILGAANGMMDVAMNARAVEVERSHRRPIMSAFHAVFSIGGMIGAGVGALFLALNSPISLALPVSGLALACLVLVSTRFLLSSRAAITSVAERKPGAPMPGKISRRVPLLASLLGILAFSGMVVEGAAADWSGVHLREVVGAHGGVVALGYVGFSATMAIGRLLGDRLVARIGSYHVVRWGGFVATVGVVLVVSGLGTIVVIAGWLLAGAGVSCVVPQIFTAAGNLDPSSSGVSLARTATLGYFGFLAGPPLIGMVAHATSLSIGLIIPAILAAMVAVSARIVQRPTRRVASEALLSDVDSPAA